MRIRKPVRALLGYGVLIFFSQFLGIICDVEEVEQVGFVIEIFVEKSSKFTQHNRVFTEESIREVSRVVVEMIGQCSSRDDNSRYEE